MDRLNKSKFKRLVAYKNIISSSDEAVFNNLSKEGRNILKELQLYKSKVAQSLNVIIDEKSQKKIQDCAQSLENMMAYIYNIVYDLENYEFIEPYDKQTEFTVPEDKDTDNEIDNEEDNTDDNIEEDNDNTEEDNDYEDFTQVQNTNEITEENNPFNDFEDTPIEEEE